MSFLKKNKKAILLESREKLQYICQQNDYLYESLNELIEDYIHITTDGDEPEAWQTEWLDCEIDLSDLLENFDTYKDPVKTKEGYWAEMSEISEFMQDEIREQLHGNNETSQEFYDKYCELHEEKLDEEFNLSHLFIYR